MDLRGCPTFPLDFLLLPCPPPALQSSCVPQLGAAHAHLALPAGGSLQSKRSMKYQSILALHSPSPFLSLPSFTRFTPVRLPRLLISQLLVRFSSFSFLWTVTSTSMKYSCLSNGEILESHFFQSTAAERSLFYLWSPWTHLFFTPCSASHHLFLN